MPVVSQKLLKGKFNGKATKTLVPFRPERLVRHNLGRIKKEATKRFYALMGKPRQRKPVSETTLPALIDAFLEWTYQNRSEVTYDWYRRRLQNIACRDIWIEARLPKWRSYREKLVMFIAK